MQRLKINRADIVRSHPHLTNHTIRVKWRHRQSFFADAKGSQRLARESTPSRTKPAIDLDDVNLKRTDRLRGMSDAVIDKLHIRWIVSRIA